MISSRLEAFYSASVTMFVPVFNERFSIHLQHLTQTLSLNEALQRFSIYNYKLCLSTIQVAPAELESVLLSHPKITDAAVIGKPDAKAGELPVAFVTVEERSLTAQQIMEYVAGKSTIINCNLFEIFCKGCKDICY